MITYFILFNQNHMLFMFSKYYLKFIDIQSYNLVIYLI